MNVQIKDRQGAITGYLSLAEKVVKEAGKIALHYFRMPLDVVNKEQGGNFDPVTRADKEVEAFIRKRLSSVTPDFAIVGEEQGSTNGNLGVDDFCWVIDPIDGTRSFISGFPTWGILLGLVVDDHCVGGIMHQPFTGETFISDSKESWLDCRLTESRSRLICRDTRELADSVIYSTDPDMFESPQDFTAFEKVARQCKLRRFGGDCYSYCMLAAGHIDLVVEGGLQPYDINALIPIVEGAGGVITNWAGDSAIAGGRVLAAANPTLHKQALQLLQTV
ncbi:MAG: histidinol-phosphatase [Porticoccaceae bacterium]|nr:histidinol-phosphatase [Porticoccaceae bacterium]